ncbi:type II secretion system F family protein [Candidatus Obscuribacterales bacterium]|nr:type II secretion system F family protein [Candidatus Obscuribacterales bacterium]MBX3136771.1 type II secretion system F family protein [Candidatus Obscuribacterales bacterium]MBX3150800.1 type II secretion system F family protein [Candidatus Obscuribacterales bacterium]
MEYVYKVRDSQGNVREAVAQAESPAILRTRLSARGLDVLDIRERGGFTTADIVARLNRILDSFEQVSLKDMVVFSRQFSAMVSSGVAMLRTLSIIVDQCPNKRLKNALDDIRRSVESGLSLSDAMARQVGIFDRLYIAIVRAGETGGILSDVLKRLADYLEYKEKLNQKVRAAMVYPSVVLLIAVGVFWAMLTFVLPVFQGLFKNIGGELPLYTQFLIALSEAVRSIYMVFFLIACGIGAYFLRRYYRTEVGRLQIDGMILSLPLFGDLIRKVAIARFSRTFGTLIRAGVPMLNALDVVKDTAGNAVVAKGIDQIYDEVRQGGTISKPMSRNQIFPPMVTQMIAVGEETGRLDDMLSKIADFYDMEVENSVEQLTSMLEPIMVVGIGGVVGSVVVGMYLPIFTVINQLR